MAFGRFHSDRFDYDFSRAFLRLIDWMLLLAMITAWLAFLAWPQYDRTYWWLLPLGICGLLHVLIFYINFLRWRRRPWRRENARYALGLLRASLISSLVCASVAYLLIGLLALPLRYQEERALDDVLLYGETKAREMK